MFTPQDFDTTQRPSQHERTLLVATSPERALRMLIELLDSSHDISNAVFDPTRGIALRFEESKSGVEQHRESLTSPLEQTECTWLEDEHSKTFWQRKP